MRRRLVLEAGVKKDMASKAMVTTLTKDFPDPVSIISKKEPSLN
jgi:hypothetical protein